MILILIKWKGFDIDSYNFFFVIIIFGKIYKMVYFYYK